MSRLIVVSPHLDDAVFSCGTLIHAHAVAEQPPLVVTVFAGVPPPGLLTNLDAAAGFTSSADAMAVRRIEDTHALAYLGAEPLHLDLLDAQYNVGPDAMTGEQRRNAVRDALEGIYEGRGKQTIVAPVGIRHVDHQHVASACRAYADYWYEELPYRVLWPDLAAEPLAAFTAPAWVILPSCAAKEQAVRQYRSQIGDGDPGPELAESERYHRL